MAIVSNNPTANDPASCITAVWDALQHWRSLALEPNDPTDDEDWNKITEAMAWITEQLDCEVDSNGDTVHVEPDCKIVQCTNGLGEWELVLKDGGSEVFDTFDEAQSRALELFPFKEGA
tara:strand:+ start:7037 stop:7393 length:357 start_codon:yes stop_codon:yes gene_type:complete